ncbi:metal ABC transporter substrate-binding protein [Halalkalirubrum salinum]|uniref:metal ABC transporter substrate-binding protein n=1 Tax=Halalkalirubrum salinum TaxID=2563889 RepID=UPI0010FBBA04|nr:metal ABC transporter substrate-binding protein [Halalkalirubrum salinum]
MRNTSGSIPRRKALQACGGAVTAAMFPSIAGCTGAGGQPRSDADEGASEYTVVASFFTFYDFGRKIANGTPLRVENLVPTGMHGHGWEPDPSITRDIIDADGFIHVGEDFQPWADRAIETLEEDDDAETALINARKEVELIDLADSLEADEQVGSGKDPHFWLDPIRATAAVENIREGLTTIAPDHEETFAENAEAVVNSLKKVDEEWANMIESGDRDVVFLAAHNAFEYIGQRYDVTIQPLVTNLAASNDVRPADMRRAQETIAENGIEHIGAAVFEPRRPAEQLLEQTDVEAYYPVTPYAGTTKRWVDNGWGYLEIAREINMKTFEIILGASEPDTSFDDEWRNFGPL